MRVLVVAHRSVSVLVGVGAAVTGQAERLAGEDQVGVVADDVAVGPPDRAPPLVERTPRPGWASGDGPQRVAGAYDVGAGGGRRRRPGRTGAVDDRSDGTLGEGQPGEQLAAVTAGSHGRGSRAGDHGDAAREQHRAPGRPARRDAAAEQVDHGRRRDDPEPAEGERQCDDAGSDDQVDDGVGSGPGPRGAPRARHRADRSRGRAGHRQPDDDRSKVWAARPRHPRTFRLRAFASFNERWRTSSTVGAPPVENHAPGRPRLGGGIGSRHVLGARPLRAVRRPGGPGGRRVGGGPGGGARRPGPRRVRLGHARQPADGLPRPRRWRSTCRTSVASRAAWTASARAGACSAAPVRTGSCRCACGRRRPRGQRPLGARGRVVGTRPARPALSAAPARGRRRAVPAPPRRRLPPRGVRPAGRRGLPRGARTARRAAARALRRPRRDPEARRARRAASAAQVASTS